MRRVHTWHFLAIHAIWFQFQVPVLKKEDQIAIWVNSNHSRAGWSRPSPELKIWSSYPSHQRRRTLSAPRRRGLPSSRGRIRCPRRKAAQRCLTPILARANRIGPVAEHFPFLAFRPPLTVGGIAGFNTILLINSAKKQIASEVWIASEIAALCYAHHPRRLPIQPMVPLSSTLLTWNNVLLFYFICYS